MQEFPLRLGYLWYLMQVSIAIKLISKTGQAFHLPHFDLVLQLLAIAAVVTILVASRLRPDAVARLFRLLWPDPLRGVGNILILLTLQVGISNLIDRGLWWVAVAGIALLQVPLLYNKWRYGRSW